MAFRKRNVDLSRAPASASSRTPSAPLVVSARGTRPSVVDGRLIISTGTPSLDGLLAGHGGLALGNSLLIEESGSTDYGGALMKYFAAEGVAQGHTVHVVGAGEAWGRALPGLVENSRERERERDEDKGRTKGSDGTNERMKIAWRYERLAKFGASSSASGSRASSSPNSDTPQSDVFCHTFDLTKKLTLPATTDIKYHAITIEPNQSPFIGLIASISQMLAATQDQGSIHRVVIPTILSPALYPLHACEPQNLLQFIHQLRSLLRQFPQQLTIMCTLPLELHPRPTGLVRWLELLSDGVLELTPFPHASYDAMSLSTSGAATAQEQQPQGMVKIHKLPVFHERFGGGGNLKGLGDDLAFTVSRRKFAIKPFSLPPAEGDTEAQQGKAENPAGKLTKDKLDF